MSRLLCLISRSVVSLCRPKINQKKLLLLLSLEEEDDELVLALCKKRKKPNEMFKNRENEGAFYSLIDKYLKCNDDKFIEYFRLSREQFARVLGLIERDITKQPTNKYPRPISPSPKLAVTIRFLATGESFRSLAFQFRICHSYLSKIVEQTLQACCNHLKPIYLPKVTKEKMIAVAKDFLEKWNFPNCCGAVDGKHCRIQCPPNSGSLFYNYKHFFSIVLMALVDAHCKFICVDIGSYGKEGDSGIFSKSELGKHIENERFPFPDDERLPGSEVYFPHFIIGDGGFKLLPRLMKPYSNAQSEVDAQKRQFNYRLSRARRTVESAFGILANVFRVFHTPMILDPKTIDYVILASCCLHNMLIEDKQKSSPIINFAGNNKLSPDNLISLRRTGGAGVVSAINLRNELKDYLCSPQGRVTWQSNIA